MTKRYLRVLTTGDIKDTVTGELIRGSRIGDLLNELHEENKQLKQYKDAVWNCDSSKIIRVNRNTGEVDLVDKEYSDES